MPATPAWPPKSLPRLFVRQPLSEGVAIELDAAQANYLGNVLRMSTGAELLVFDGSSGEWLARIAEASKKQMRLSVERRTREPETIPDVWLAFAPVKRAQTDWLVEKATELGAARLIPVITRRTVVERVKLERLENIAIEAAEQCGRTRLPEIAEPLSLGKLLDHRDAARTLYFADEAGGERAADAFTRRTMPDSDWTGGRLHGRRAQSNPSGAEQPWRFRSAHGSFAPKPQRLPRWRRTWRWRATGDKLPYRTHKLEGAGALFAPSLRARSE